MSFSKTVVVRYRMHLESRNLAPGIINLRPGAVRRLAYEAADCGLLSADLAAGIRRVKGVKKLGVRLGNWLTADQSQALWQAPVPVPDWVRVLLGDWMKSAGITRGSLFRRVSSAGRVWGERVTEKLVWHVVKEANSRRTTSGGVALASVVPLAASWNRFNFSSATSRSKPPSATSAAPNEFHPPSTTASA